jgi:hypothetical protein
VYEFRRDAAIGVGEIGGWRPDAGDHVAAARFSGEYIEAIARWSAGAANEASGKSVAVEARTARRRVASVGEAGRWRRDEVERGGPSFAHQRFTVAEQQSVAVAAQRQRFLKRWWDAQRDITDAAVFARDQSAHITAIAGGWGAIEAGGDGDGLCVHGRILARLARVRQ